MNNKYDPDTIIATTNNKGIEHAQGIVNTPEKYKTYMQDFLKENNENKEFIMICLYKNDKKKEKDFNKVVSFATSIKAA